MSTFTSSQKTITTVVGARPQFIKAAVISRALQARESLGLDGSIDEILVHTGQHFDDNMSGVFFDQLQIKKPDHYLGVNGGRHGRQTAEMLWRLEEVLLSERPDLVLIYGDTNSTVAAALAASKLQIPVAHVEAGLRSFNRAMPEELNRIVADHLSTLLFAPTRTAVNQLGNEGITTNVYLTGDVMFDSMLQNLELAESRSRILNQLGVQPGRYVLATVHRAENTDNPERLMQIVEALCAIARSESLIWPLHPRTRKTLAGMGIDLTGEKLRVTEPLSYLDLLMLEKNARVILTDSGGMQKEACWLQVPCVTLRDQTEWVETVELGWNRLAGAEKQNILDALANARPGVAFEEQPGSGTRIVEKLVEFLFQAGELPTGSVDESYSTIETAGD